MMRRRIQGALLALLVTVLPVAGSATAQDAGAFVRNGFGVRGPGLGNALVADAGASPFYNPALAPLSEGQVLSATVSSLSFDRTVQTVQFATPQARAGFAIGLLHSAVSEIDGRDNAGFHSGMLSTDEFAGFLAFGLRLGGAVTGGISLQGFRSDLYPGLDPVSTIGLDLGLTAAVHRSVRIGLVLDDLLARYSWDTTALYADGGKATTDYFPTRIRIGAAGRFLDERLALLLEWENRFSRVETLSRTVSLLGTSPVEFTDTETLVLGDSFVRMGAEYAPVDVLRLRLGLDRTRGGSRPGFGVAISQQLANLHVEAEYTFVSEPFGLGAAHSAGLRLFLDRH